MAKIIPVKKYDILSDTFTAEINKQNRVNSLSYVKDEYIHDESDTNYEYIIFANGYRVKDITLDGLNTYGENNFTRRIVNYFKNKKKNVVVIHILLDSDAPLDLEAKIIAKHVDQLARQDNVSTINLIGHSKCGAMFFNMPKYFKNKRSFEKSFIYTSAAPFRGCLIASPRLFLHQVKEAVFSKLPKPISELTFKALKKYYNTSSSNSHMDNDIAIPGTLTERYDPDFIRCTFDKANIEAIKKVRKFQNFITGVDDESLVKSLKRQDYTSVGLCLMDRYFMDETTDGFIELRSQESVSEYVDVPTIRIASATHNYLAHNDELGIILDSVNQNIDEEHEKNREQKTMRYRR